MSSRNIIIVARNGKGARLSHNPKTGVVKPVEFQGDALAADTSVALEVLNHTLEQLMADESMKTTPVSLITFDRLVIKVLEIRKHMRNGLTGSAVTAEVVRDWDSEEGKLELDRLVGLLTALPNVRFTKLSEIQKMSRANVVGQQFKELINRAWAMVPPAKLVFDKSAEGEVESAF